MPENRWWATLLALCLMICLHATPGAAGKAAAQQAAPAASSAPPVATAPALSATAPAPAATASPGSPAGPEAELTLPAGFPQTVAKALRAAKLPATAIGFFVQDVTATKPALALNPERAMNPASVMKLVTTYSALELLGPSFVWKTGFFANGTLRGDVLDGDLIIKGSGDPKFSQEQLWLALKAVRARGVREIRGNILLDRSGFDANGYDASKFDGDPLRAYNAGPDALLINFKALALTFAPDDSAAGVTVSAEPRGLPVRSAVKLANGACAEFRAAPVKAKIDAAGIQLSGTYSASCGVKTWWLHPFELSHQQYAAAVIRQLWGDTGGVLNGEVRDGSVPAGARLLYEAESQSLAEITRDINKFSNNVMARQLFLTLSAETLKMAGSAERSARAVKTWLTEKKIGGEELVMENGSGLSRIERISAGAMGRMLVAAFKSPVMPELMSSMPLVAYDGTMRRRLKARDIAGQAHIKTGSLNDVRSIGGYVLAASGRRYAVVFMVNHGNAGASQGAQDALLQWVYAEG